MILLMVRDYIKDTPNKVEALSAQLHEVYKHYLLLEDYNFKYDYEHMTKFWYLKCWPLEISAYLTDGIYMI